MLHVFFVLWKKLVLKMNWLTDSMELSPFWEASGCATTEELLNILWNTTLHYCVHSPPVHILSQINPVHTILPLGTTALGEPWPPLQQVSTALYP
jgi:hypothetical protein